MYITRVVVKNFRNLRAIDVSLESGLTCVVGENNSGKTNLLTALRLALDANLPNYYRTLTKEDFSKGLDVSTPQQILVGVEITDFYDEEQDEKVKELALAQEWAIEQNIARVCYRFRPNAAVRQAIESGERDGTGLSIEDYEYEMVGGAVTDNEGNLKDLNRIEWDDDFQVFVKIGRLSAFRVVSLPAIRDVEEDLRRSNTSPLRKLLEAVDIPEDKKEGLIGKVRKANDELSEQDEIKALASDISSSMLKSVGSTFKMDVGLGMASPTFASIARALRVLLSGQGLDEADPSRNGLGLNNVLYISMLMAYFEKRTQQDSTAGQLLLIEEPEAHLHPQLQRVLFARLLAKECQIVATSHSTHISSRAKLDNLLILTTEDTGLTTTCRPATTLATAKDNISDLERYLDATKSVLLFARRVILVEGMSEVFLIPCLVKQVMNVDLEEHGISFVPVYGVHFDSYLKLFVDKGIRKKCAVITDGDLKPSDATGTGEDEFPRIEDLKQHESDLIRIFNCTTTFERAIALPQNLKVFAEAAKELGATTVSTQLNDFYDRGKKLTKGEQTQARNKVLNTAKRFGKARFAQIASKYAVHAEVLPGYIREAIEWIIA